MRIGIIVALLLCPASLWAKPLEKLNPKEITEKVILFEHAKLDDVLIETKKDFVDNCGVTYNIEIREENKTYKFTLTRPFARETVPLVIGIPTIKGPTVLEGRLDSLFCNDNVAYVLADVMPLKFNLTKDGVSETNKEMINGVRAIRTFLDYLETNPFPGEFIDQQIDLNRVGVMGLSNGGTAATFLAAVDSRVKATVIMGSPGNIPHALAYSAEVQVDEFRTVQMEHHGLTTSDEFEMFLREQITVSPVQLAPLIDKNSVYQIIIDPDIIVPTIDQMDLWEGLGRPDRFITEGPHTDSIIGMVYLDSTTLRDFLEKKLGVKK